MPDQPNDQICDRSSRAISTSEGLHADVLATATRAEVLAREAMNAARSAEARAREAEMKTAAGAQIEAQIDALKNHLRDIAVAQREHHRETVDEVKRIVSEFRVTQEEMSGRIRDIELRQSERQGQSDSQGNLARNMWMMLVGLCGAAFGALINHIVNRPPSH